MFKSKITKILIYFLPVLLILLLVFLYNNNFKKIQKFFGDTFLSEYIEDKYAYSSFVGDEKLLASPISEKHFGIAVSKDRPAIIEFPFSQVVNLSGFSVYFYGNLHSVSSYLAENFKVYYKNNHQWRLVDIIQGNRSSHYALKMDENKEIRAFKLVISKATIDNSVELGDLKFYIKRSASFAQGVTNFINYHSKGFLSYVWYTFIFYLILLIPGYTLLHFISNPLKINLDVNYKIVFSPIISIVILAVLSSAFIFTKIALFLDIYIPFFVISLFLFLRLGLYKELKKGIFPLFIIASVLFIVNLLQAERDFLFNLDYIEKYLDQLKFIPLRGGYYGYHADNTLQWGIARSFLHQVPIFSEEAENYRLGHGGVSVFARTPLLPVVVTPILKLFGESHFIYQRFLNVLMSLYYGGAYLLVKSYFSKRTAKIVTVLMLLSVHLTYQTFNTEIYLKYFAIYPIFLALILINKESRLSNLIVGLLIAISFFIHPMALIFIAVLFFVYLKRYRISQKFFEKSFVSFFPTFLLFIGWTLFARYMKLKAGLDTLNGKNIYIEKIFSFRLEYLFNKLINVINIFVPDVLLRGFNGTMSDPKFLNYFIATFLRFSIISALSPIFIIIIIFSLINKQSKKYWEPLCLGVGPLIIFLFALHAYSLGGYAIVYPFILPFLFGFIVSQLNPMNFEKRLLVLVSYPLFMLLPLYYFSGIFIGMRYASISVSILLGVIILTYIFLTFLLLQLGGLTSVSSRLNKYFVKLFNVRRK